MKTKLIARNVVSATVFLVFVVLAIGSSESEKNTATTRSQTASYNLTADQLSKEYEANEVAADNKYKGQVVVVSGSIKDIGKDILDDPYVVIGGLGFLDGVQCMFSKSESSSIAALSKEQSIRIKGQVEGKLIGNVLLKSCSIQ